MTNFLNAQDPKNVNTVKQSVDIRVRQTRRLLRLGQHDFAKLVSKSEVQFALDVVKSHAALQNYSMQNYNMSMSWSRQIFTQYP